MKYQITEYNGVGSKAIFETQSKAIAEIVLLIARTMTDKICLIQRV